MKPLFVGVDARCRHDNPIPSECEGCAICDWENDILSATPPFKVECIDDATCSLTKGRIYTVLAVVKDGAVAWGDKEGAPGVLIESDELAYPYLYRVDRFVINNNDEQP